MSSTPRSEALGAIHETIRALHQIGAVDRETMDEFDKACMTEAMPAQLSEQQAADYLNVSVEFLRRQVEIGELAYANVPDGTILNSQDVAAYKQRMDSKRRLALDELAAQAQELGMGYDER